MQINAIGSLNFKGNDYKYNSRENKDYSTNLTKDDYAFVNELIEKANLNVHPTTILASIATFLLAAKSAGKLVPMARRGSVKAAEVVSKVAVNIADATAKGISKLARNEKIAINAEAAKNKISSKAEQLLNKDNKINDEFVGKCSNAINGVVNFVNDILGREQTSFDAANILNKLGINNKVSAADAVAACAIAATTIDPVSDKVENMKDAKDIMRGIRNAMTDMDDIQGAMDIVGEAAEIVA